MVPPNFALETHSVEWVLDGHIPLSRRVGDVAGHRKLNWEEIRLKVVESAAQDPRWIGPHLPPTPSPAWRTFVFDWPYPEKLYFRGVVVVLETAYLHGNWRRLHAKKLTPEGDGGEILPIFTEPHGRQRLEESLYRIGFAIQDGSPAARVMDCLVRLRFAHVRPPRSNSSCCSGLGNGARSSSILPNSTGARHSGTSFFGELTSDETGTASISLAAYGSANAVICSRAIGPGSIHRFASSSFRMTGMRS